MNHITQAIRLLLPCVTSSTLYVMKISKGYRFSEDVCKVLDNLTSYTRRSETNVIEVAILEYGKTILPPERQAEKKKKAASGKLKSKE